MMFTRYTHAVFLFSSLYISRRIYWSVNHAWTSPRPPGGRRNFSQDSAKLGRQHIRFILPSLFPPSLQKRYASKQKIKITEQDFRPLIVRRYQRSLCFRGLFLIKTGKSFRPLQQLVAGQIYTPRRIICQLWESVFGNLGCRRVLVF